MTTRPLPVTVLCVVLFLAAALNVIGVVRSFVAAPLGRALWIAFTQGLTVVSTVGLWRMRRWAVYLYLGGYAVGTAAFFIFPPSGAEAYPLAVMIAVPLIYCAVVLPYWKRLS